MNYETTYNPKPHLTRWMRFQAWAYDRYKVDAGNMVTAMVIAFMLPIVLGSAAAYYL